MSQHSSLRSKAKDAIYRSVTKRYERLKDLKEKEKWNEEETVYGLPKQKITKFKIKKEKSAEAKETAEATQGTAAPTVAAPAKEAAKPEAKGKEAKK